MCKGVRMNNSQDLKEDIFNNILKIFEEFNETEKNNTSIIQDTSYIIENASFAFTGALRDYTRSEVSEICNNYGLIYHKLPIQSTTYLVVGKDASAVKILKAEKNGTMILNEDQFADMISHLKRV